MDTFRNQDKNIISIAIFLALLAVTPKPIGAVAMLNPVVAQAAAPTSFPLPAEVPGGTTVRVDGSSSMKRANQALKQRFEQQFRGTKVELAAQGSDRALKELVEGKIDLAAIGRPLTTAEKAQGLVQVPLSRQKMAIVVGPENSFNKSLTFDQFARIFRGEIKNWSQVGGKPGIVRLIDRPADADISPRGEETATLDGRIPWWMWLLGISALGGLLWWLLKDRRALAASSAGTLPGAMRSQSLITCRFWYD